MRLALQGIRKRYGHTWVLDGIDLQVAAGSIAALAGGNGSGKSTLLRIAAGAAEPTAGQARRPRSIGYVPERLPSTLRMTARQYLRHMGRMRGLQPAAADTRSMALLEQLALVPGPDLPIGKLSKGNSQKVALAQALLVPVDLLVLDEPYSGLDEAAAVECTALVRDARDHGAGVLVSAHEDGAVPEADLQLALAAGRLAECSGRDGLMRVVLSAIDGRADIHELAGLPGVCRIGSDPGALVVMTTDADGLLRAALGRGWSLREARR